MGGGYLGSNWATPAIIVTYKDGEEIEIEMFVSSESYNSDVMWSEEDVKRLNKGEQNKNVRNLRKSKTNCTSTSFR